MTWRDLLNVAWSYQRHSEGAKGFSELSPGISWLPPLNTSQPEAKARGTVLPLFPLGGLGSKRIALCLLLPLSPSLSIYLCVHECVRAHMCNLTAAGVSAVNDCFQGLSSLAAADMVPPSDPRALSFDAPCTNLILHMYMVWYDPDCHLQRPTWEAK